MKIIIIVYSCRYIFNRWQSINVYRLFMLVLFNVKERDNDVQRLGSRYCTVSRAVKNNYPFHSVTICKIK